MKRNSQQSTTVDYYKMFKDGKHWVYAGDYHCGAR